MSERETKINYLKIFGISVGITITYVVISVALFGENQIGGLIKFSSENADEIARWATLIGVPIGIGAIVYAYFIKRQVDNISNKQKENAQGPYKINTNNNLNEIHNYFKDVIRLTKNIDPEKSDLDESIDDSSITAELESYYQQNTKKMNKLLDKSTQDLLAWYDLDKDIRPKFQEIIDSLQWLINDFFQSDGDEEMQTRVWTDNHDELLKRKFKIEKIINEFQTILT